MWNALRCVNCSSCLYSTIIIPIVAVFDIIHKIPCDLRAGAAWCAPKWMCTQADTEERNKKIYLYARIQNVDKLVESEQWERMIVECENNGMKNIINKCMI